MFEKIVKQVTNRIDELDENIKRSGNSSRGSDGMSGKDNTPSRPISRPRQPSGGTGSSDGTSRQKNAQWSKAIKDLDEIKGLMQRLLKSPLQQHLGACSTSPSY